MNAAHAAQVRANGVRYSSGVIIWRNTGKDLEILLVRSTSGKSWVFPKGGVEEGLSEQQNALKEAWEEAGALGQVGECVGHYRYKKDDVQQRVSVYEMECIAELGDYPEVNIRPRRWFSLFEAQTLLSKDLRKCLEQFCATIFDIDLVD